ncbi:MAG: ROK family protein [Planctomycetia bacterium]|nr:ROK family protein [Planctomycetia bacterium]
MTAQKYLAIDIGGSKIMTAIASVSSKGNRREAALSAVAKESLARDAGEQGILDTLERLVLQSFAETGTSWLDIAAIGVTIPGVARADDCFWVYAPFSGIGNFPIGQILRAKYNRPVYGQNDVNACAWAEHLFGVCQDVQDFLWITISNGIGGGLVLNGQVFPGATGGAAEIGHFQVVPNGALCGCGRRGCLEAEAAGPAIARRCRELLAQESNYNFPVPPDQINAALIADAARGGNPIALETYRQTGHLLGHACALAANLINPAKIVFGGGVIGAFDLFRPQLEKTFFDEVFLSVNRHVTLEATGLGYEAGLLGALACAFGREDASQQ